MTFSVGGYKEINATKKVHISTVSKSLPPKYHPMLPSLGPGFNGAPSAVGGDTGPRCLMLWPKKLF